MRKVEKRTPQRGMDGAQGRLLIRAPSLRSHVRSITRWQPCVSASLMSNCYIKKRGGETRKKWVTEFPGIPCHLICRPDALLPPLMWLPRPQRPPECAAPLISRPETNIRGGFGIQRSNYGKRTHGATGRATWARRGHTVPLPVELLAWEQVPLRSLLWSFQKKEKKHAGGLWKSSTSAGDLTTPNFTDYAQRIPSQMHFIL